MKKDRILNEEDFQILQNRVIELERQLAHAQTTILALEAEKEEINRFLQNKTDPELKLLREQDFRQALLAAPYPLLIWREDGKVMMVNAAFTEITGYTLENISTFEAWLREAIDKHAIGQLSGTYTEGAPAPDRKKWREFEITIRSGEKRIWDFSDALLGLDQTGQRLRIIMAVDITERRQIEEQLEENEEKFSIVFDKAPFAAALSKFPEGAFVDTNDEFERVFGYTRREMLGRTSLELGINPDLEGRKRILSQIQAQGSVRNAEVALQTKSLETRVFFLNIDMVSIGGERYMLQTAQDITERKRAEKALRESEERFRSLANSMPQLVWTALPDGRVDYYNERHKEYQDIKRREGDDWDWAPVLHPDDAQATVDAWLHALETGNIYQIEHRVRMADGSFRWHLSRGIPMVNEMGQVLRWFGTATDIHDLKLAEEQLRVYANQLEQSNRELEQFAFMASHDLQEPLRKIEMFGDLLLERATSLQNDELGYINRMRNAAGRMRDMIEGLLQLSRVATQGKPFVRVNLKQITSDVLSDLENQMKYTGGQIEIDALPVLTGDPLQLRQLMQNLIGNALKYHEPGKPPVVKISARQLAEKIQIVVEDQGIGFLQEDADRIFEPFQRLVGRSQFEGSGIGLAICRRIVDRHGGEIAAISEPGQGTTFIVTLPVQPPQKQKSGHERIYP